MPHKPPSLIQHVLVAVSVSTVISPELATSGLNSVLVLPLQRRSLLPEKLESVPQSSLLVSLAVHEPSLQTVFHDLELKQEEVHHVLKLESQDP